MTLRWCLPISNLYPPPPFHILQVAEIGCYVVMVATLLTAFLFASGQGGPFFLQLRVYEVALSGCLEAWSTFTTITLALYMREQSRLGVRSAARGSSFWQRNRRALWTLTVLCIVLPLAMTLINLIVPNFTKLVS